MSKNDVSFGAMLEVLTVTLLALSGCTAGDGSGPSSANAGSGDVDGGTDTHGSDLFAGDSTEAPILMITVDDFAAEAREHATYRRDQGHAVEVLTLSDIWGSAAPINRTDAVDAIIEVISTRFDGMGDAPTPLFVLLLGDDTETWNGDASWLPAGRYQSPWHDEGLPSDNVFADMDGDDAPDVAVGRIPAQSAGEAAMVLDRVRAYETSAHFGAERRRLDLFAGEPGFGNDIDTAMETAFYEAVEEFSYDFDVTMTYADPNSPYGYPDDLISDRIYEILNAGPLMAAYIGHGGSGGIGVLDETQIESKLQCPAGRPIMLSIACSTGSFDRPRCLAEQLLFADEGPVAVYAATAVSHPSHNAELVYGYGDGLLNERLPTVGQLNLHAEREMMFNEGGFYQMIWEVSTLFEEEEDLEVLTPAHAHMYTLFGDPALRIAYPADTVDLTVADSPRRVGEPLTISGCIDSMTDGQVQLTLESQRSAILGDLWNVPGSGPGRDEAIVHNNETANNKVISTTTAQLSDGCFEVGLPVPDTTPPARFWVKGYASSASGDAIGSVAVTVTD